MTDASHTTTGRPRPRRTLRVRLASLLFRLTLPVGRAHVWCADRWRDGWAIALLGWLPLRLTYVTAYAVIVWLYAEPSA